jgi:hypothetical protein
MDMARGEEGDKYDNYISIQSQCQQYIDDVLARLHYYYTDQPDITLTGITYTPFKEKYQDELAGMTASITIQVPTPLNACVYPFQSFKNVVSVQNATDNTIGADPGIDDVFPFATVIYDPESAWDTNKYTSLTPGEYEFKIDQNITINQPAVGETIPTQPVIQQIVEGARTDIQPIFAEGWPTSFESATKQYRFRATYRAVVPAVGPSYVWEFVHIADVVGQAETSIQQLTGGTLKIGREE